jgi:hypothetical protein
MDVILNATFALTAPRMCIVKKKAPFFNIFEVRNLPYWSYMYHPCELHTALNASSCDKLTIEVGSHPYSFVHSVNGTAMLCL